MSDPILDRGISENHDAFYVMQRLCELYCKYEETLNSGDGLLAHDDEYEEEKKYSYRIGLEIINTMYRVCAIFYRNEVEDEETSKRMKEANQ